MLAHLDDRLGFRVHFPNIYPLEAGLQTPRGLVGYRAVQALYLVWRMKQLLGERASPRILEIGAGLGWSAYYAMKAGFESYTLIDLPLSGAAQGYHIGRILGEENVAFWGEEQTAPVSILPPAAFEQLDGPFDLVVNVDSLTEMSESTARGYLAGARRLSGRFLSINHEANPFTVESLYRKMHGIKAQRSPCWMRKGYVEELIEFPEGQ
nr:putative sugar O-methyltransferase [Fundidesulfovibrio soli]